MSPKVSTREGRRQPLFNQGDDTENLWMSDNEDAGNDQCEIGVDNKRESCCNIVEEHHSPDSNLKVGVMISKYRSHYLENRSNATFDETI